MATFYVLNFYLSTKNSEFENLVVPKGIPSFRHLPKLVCVWEGQQKGDAVRMGIGYERIMINIQNRNFLHSGRGRGRTISSGVAARIIQLFPVSFLCSPFGSLSFLAFPLLSSQFVANLSPKPQP
jgi:hypothetical protein